jgi:hypothetical protein
MHDGPSILCVSHRALAVCLAASPRHGGRRWMSPRLHPCPRLPEWMQRPQNLGMAFRALEKTVNGFRRPRLCRPVVPPVL